MTLSFTVIETTMTPVWDYGWFDLTRFKIDGLHAHVPDCTSILEQFLRDPISQRSFCDPGAWGEPIERHGPFLHDKLATEYFRPIAVEEFSSRIEVVLDDPDFTEKPSVGQRQRIEAWIGGVRARGDDVFVLEVPDPTEARVEWHSVVWWVYQEFVSISQDRTELAIGVIGYD